MYAGDKNSNIPYVKEVLSNFLCILNIIKWKRFLGHMVVDSVLPQYLLIISTIVNILNRVGISTQVHVECGDIDR